MTHWRTARVIDINSGRQSPRGLNKAPPAASLSSYSLRESSSSADWYREISPSPALKERVALIFFALFIGALAVGTCAAVFFIGLIVDWNGVVEAALHVARAVFHLTDLS